MRVSYLLGAAGVLLVVIFQASTPTSAQVPVKAARPAAPAPGAQAAEASGVIARGNVEHGRYLAEHVANCIECHSGRDAEGNILESEKYTGGSIPFTPPWPGDWATRAPRNKGLPGYTDEQALRLLTQGAIDHNGNQLRAPMPKFQMTPQDAADVIAFLRSLP
jgi:mono/diheme cytochrome c family protein